MKQVTISDAMSAASLFLSLRSSRDLDRLADLPNPGLIASLVEMMDPVNTISALRDLKLYLLTLPTTYPDIHQPYTTVQRGVLSGLKETVRSLDPTSFNVLGIPVTTLFISSMQYADEVVFLAGEVMRLIDLELARGVPAPAGTP